MCKSYNFFLVGCPLEHSLSPFIHQKLREFGEVEATYKLCPVPPDRFPEDFPAEMAAADGCNVTTPYKTAVIPFLDRPEGRAALYRSVNTVARVGERLVGYNTDAEGFLGALKEAGIALRGRVLLLGSGGVARTFACEAVLAGCAVVNAVREQSREKAEAIRKTALALRNVPYEIVGYDEIAGDFDLLLNATTVGMYPHTDECPVPDGVLKRTKAVFDAVYNPAETELLRLAAACGAKTAGGMAMLVRQAAAAETLWCGAAFTDEQLSAVTAAAGEELRRRFGNLILCGFMGSGKTAVGRKLAAAMGRRFFDLDAEVERMAGAAVGEIFAREGEETFRRYETEICRRLSREQNAVIAAGGGTLLSPENAAFLRRTGRTVFLDVSPETVLNRLRDDDTRPLLQTPDRRQTVHRLLAERRPVYLAAADFTVDADTPVDTVVAAITAIP